MITLEANGSRYEGFTDISIFKSIETISGSFSFAATTSTSNLFPIKAGNTCAAFIDGNQVINGYVDSVDISYDSISHSIAIRGRDRTCDLVDSSLIGVKEFNGMSLTSIIQKVLADNNMSAIKVINNTNSTLEPFSNLDPSSSPVSQTLFEFLEGLARKRQVLLSTDGNGNIVLARSGSITAETVLQNNINNNLNNIKSATANYDYSQRFNKYVLQSGQNVQAFAFASNLEYDNASSQDGESIDSNIRESRVSEVISETSDSSTNLKELATWTKNLSTARSTQYSCTVQGYYSNKANTLLWQPNMLVQISDDFADINATLLIKSVEYNLGLDTGSTTTLTLVDKDAYTLQAKIDSANAKANKKGIEFLDFTGDQQ